MFRRLAPLALLLACSGRNITYHHPGLRGRAEREVRLDLAAAADRELDLATDFGTISVRASERAEPRLVARLILRARTGEEAREAIGRFGVALEEKGGRLVLERTGEPFRLPDSTYRIQPRLELVAIVRPGQRLRAVTGSGAIDVVGALSDCDLETSFGDISVAGVNGETLRAVTDSGKIRLQAVRVARIELTTAFGGLRLDEVRGDLTARTSTGNIVLRDFAGGRCTLEASLGDIKAQGVFTELRAVTGSGDVDVWVAPASRPDGPWTLESGLGDIGLTLPDEIDCEIAATTAFGSIRCDLPLDDVRRKETQLRGRLCRGGALLRLTARSGDISMRCGAGGRGADGRAGPAVGRRRRVDPGRAAFEEPIYRLFESRSLLITMENAGAQPVVAVAVAPPDGVKLVEVTSPATPGRWDAPAGEFVFDEPVAPGGLFRLQVTIDRFSLGETTTLNCCVRFRTP